MKGDPERKKGAGGSVIDALSRRFSLRLAFYLGAAPGRRCKNYE
jgi:hypothetical protein